MFTARALTNHTYLMEGGRSWHAQQIDGVYVSWESIPLALCCTIFISGDIHLLSYILNSIFTILK